MAKCNQLTSLPFKGYQHRSSSTHRKAGVQGHVPPPDIVHLFAFIYFVEFLDNPA